MYKWIFDLIKIWPYLTNGGTILLCLFLSLIHFVPLPPWIKCESYLCLDAFLLYWWWLSIFVGQIQTHVNKSVERSIWLIGYCKSGRSYPFLFSRYLHVGVLAMICFVLCHLCLMEKLLLCVTDMPPSPSSSPIFFLIKWKFSSYIPTGWIHLAIN